MVFRRNRISLVQLIISPEFWLATALFLGRSPLSRFMIPIDMPYCAAAVALVVAMIASLIPRKRHKSPHARKIIAVYSIALVALMISFYWSTRPDYALDKILGFALLTYFPALLIAIIAVNADYLSLAFIALGIVLVLGSLASGIGEFIAKPGRLSAFGGGPNTFGRFMAIATIAAYSSNIPYRALLSSIFIIGTVMSQSRGAFLSLVATFGFYLIYGDTKTPRKVGTTVVIVAILLIVGWSVLPTGLRSLLMLRFGSVLKDMPGSSSIVTRKIMATDALEAFWAKPITGLGLGAFRDVSITRYPHNLILEILSETGLFGATAILLPVLLSGIRCCTLWGCAEFGKKPYPYWYAFAVLSALFSGDIVDSRTAYVFAALVLCYAPKQILSKRS